MKMITAFIKPHKLTPVTLALHRVEGLTGATVTDVRGFGRPKPKGTPGRFADQFEDYGRYVKLEIVCEDELVKEVIHTLQKAAHTGLRGDGKIYVSPVETSVRISTGEQKGNPL